ncbi:MAG: helix-turn-helix transcriptional regulator [Hahellaceae bacterium]|nr:helix-turn-helix transcriptional regulator [Hahellaceae bacterium]
MQSESPLPIQLKKARKAKNLTQQELGIRVGLDPGNASARMNQYESGKHSPDYKMLKKMASELGVPVPYLFCDDALLGEIILALSKVSDEEKIRVLESLQKK